MVIYGLETKFSIMKKKVDKSGSQIIVLICPQQNFKIKGNNISLREKSEELPKLNQKRKKDSGFDMLDSLYSPWILSIHNNSISGCC